MSDLLLIVPSFGHPDRIIGMDDAIRCTARGSVTLMPCFSLDDTTIDLEFLDEMKRRTISFTMEPSAPPFVDSVNEVAMDLRDAFRNIGCVSDEWHPGYRKGWDLRLARKLQRDITVGEAPAPFFATNDFIEAHGYLVAA